MSQVTSGMDIAEVRNLATQLHNAANEIQQLMSRLTPLVHNAAWRGPDQVRFVGDWDGHHSSALRQVAEALNQASQAANANATQQEQASGH